MAESTPPIGRQVSVSGSATVIDYKATMDRMTQEATAAMRVADACTEAWDVLDDLAHGDWGLIDQARARAALIAIIEANDARDGDLADEAAAPTHQHA